MIMITGFSLLSSIRHSHEYSLSSPSHHASRSTLQYLPGAAHSPRPRTCIVGTGPRGRFLRPSDYRRCWLPKRRLFPSDVQCHASVGRSLESKTWRTTTALRTSGYWSIAQCPQRNFDQRILLLPQCAFARQPLQYERHDKQQVGHGPVLDRWSLLTFF